MRTASWIIAMSGLAVGVAIGCNSSIVTVMNGAGGGTSRGGQTGGSGGGDTGGSPADAGEEYIDPGCPDSGMKPTDFECDAYNQTNGDCPPGEGCFIYSTPPQTVCGQETYGSACEVPGSGTQGAQCGDEDQSCAASFTCVVSGAGDQCVLLCELEGGMECPDGLVCQPIDVTGFGGCL